MQRSHALAFALFLAVFLGGCGKNESTSTPSTSPPPSAAGNAPTGGSTNAAFGQHCGKCHTVTGVAATPGGPPFKGPDLGKVAAEPTHTTDWLAEHIRNPKAHKPDSRMPAFESKMSADEIKALADYLSGLK